MGQDRRLRIHPTTFASVFDLFRLDPCIKYFHAHNLEGFCSFGTRHRRRPRQDEHILSFFLNPVGLCHVAWSYNLQTCSTRAVLISTDPFLPYLRRQFVLYREALIHPLFPGFVCAASVLQTTTRSIEGQLGLLTQAEKDTGSDLYLSEPDTKFFRLAEQRQDLATLSKEVGSMNVSVSASGSVISLLHEFSDVFLSDKISLANRTVDPDRQEQYDAAWDELAEAASFLQLDAKAMLNIVRNVQGRASLQLTIVSRAFNCLVK